MTEGVEVALITSFTTIGAVVLNGLFTRWSLNKKIQNVSTQVADVHDSVNGKLSKMMEGAEAVGNLQGRSEQTQERKDEKK